VPPHLVALGGGYVGLEFSQAYRRFGSRVTIIQHGPQLLSREDPDISSEVERILSAEGIECLVGAQTLRVHGRSGKDVTVLARTAAGEQRIGGTDILVAVGRTPNTTGIGLEQAGVELDDRGYVRVNARLASDDRILGFTMIGPEAGEVMAAVQAAMLAELPYPKLRDAVLAHLTMAEGLGALLSNVPSLAATAISMKGELRRPG
jgi:pyruvate/2-oxoglutarate dehydrogenase complex dihydrolipoamide dehydrogenase (E3) component